MAYFHPFEFAIDVLLSGCIDWGVGFMEPYPDPDNFPLEQPYNAPPWNYEGTESVAFLPNNNIVDWVLVELRVPPGDASTATEATRVARQAAFLLDEGHVVGLDGESNLTFEVDSSSNFHVVIWHRNHLGILSAEPLYGAPGGYMYLYQYDFISTADQAYGGPLAQKEVAPGIWGMIGADGDANGIIGIPDKEIWSLQAGEDGYQAGDYNLDGQIENKDKNDVWVQNIGENSQLPPEGDCGNQITDIDGNTYNTVQIGDQCWMKENLKTTT